jgi:predicted DNA-binding protein
LRVRVPKDLKAKLNAVAEERGEDTADVVRRFCEEGLNRHYAENNMDFIKVEIREALRDVLKPSIERLAKIGAKGSVSAGFTAMYMLVESLGRQNLDVKDIYSRARIKSVESLRSKGDIDE